MASNTVPAAPKPSARYSSSSLPSLVNAVQTPFALNIKNYDSTDSYNTSTGEYTVPLDGPYRVSARFTTDSFTPASGSLFIVVFLKNGVNFSQISQEISAGAAGKYGAAGTDTVNCVAGDILQVQIYQSSGSTVSLFSNAEYQFTSYEFIG